MKYSFPREIRLLNNTQFKKVLSGTRQKIPAEVFTIYFCSNGLDSPRLGVIVPKKSVNKSSQRNYFKRIIREKFRLSQYNLKKIDIIIFVNKTRRELSKNELNDSLEKQFGKLI